DRVHDQDHLVDQPAGERVLGESGAADADVVIGRRLRSTDRRGLELALEPGARRRHGVSTISTTTTQQGRIEEWADDGRRTTDRRATADGPGPERGDQPGRTTSTSWSRQALQPSMKPMSACCFR